MAILNKGKAPVISKERIKELLLFQERNNISFNNIALLNNAFVHSSHANESRGTETDNERLEFLGDSVLSIAVSHWLYENLEGDEGQCTKVRSVVVSEDTLSKVAIAIGVDNYILVGRGEKLSGGSHKKAILADCMEAIFAALYLDRGMTVAQEFILRLIVPEIRNVLENHYNKDYKTLLQEYDQKKYKRVPTYKMVNSVGPDHQMLFYYTVNFEGKDYGPVSGKNRKEAEQNAARYCWEQLGLDKT
ncbi:MAG: ribonuclease III [Sphaerochaetaceae bacterium]|nr:ribonuclease III [Sphaerochaetaceae bacterium]